MKREVKAGMAFLKRMLVARKQINHAKAEVFTEKMFAILCKKYEGHWYPECQSKGQAYRCIRINLTTPLDEVIKKACDECEITTINLGLPLELTLWIDPLEVSARFGEDSCSFTVEQFNHEEETKGTEEGQDKSSTQDTSNTPAAPQVFHLPQPSCSRYKRFGTVCIIPVCPPVAPPPPTVLNSHFQQQTCPQFIVPKATLQPCGYYRH